MNASKIIGSGRRLPVVIAVALVVMSGLVKGGLDGTGRAQAQDTTAAVADTTPVEITRARELLIKVQSSLDSILALERQFSGVDPESREVLRVRARRHATDLSEAQEELIRLLPSLRGAGLTTEDIRDEFAQALGNEIALYGRMLDFWTEAIDDLRSRRVDAPIEDFAEIEAEIGDVRRRIDVLLNGAVDVLAVADSLGVDNARTWEQFEKLLRTRAENLVGRLQIAVNNRERLREKLDAARRGRVSEIDIADDRTRYEYAKRRVSGVAASLERTADLLRARGYETAQYRQFVIKATGEITGRILDPKVLVGLARDGLKNAWSWVRKQAPTILVRLLILAAFAVFFRLLFRLLWWITKALKFVRVSRLMIDLVDRMVRPIGTIVGIFAGVRVRGVNPTTLLAGLGVAGVIVGFALQDSLSNLAAGFFILATRPYDVDDVIISGSVHGTVRAMGLANTTVLTFDNRRLLIPNRRIWGEVIENRSSEYTRRTEITVRVGYEQDLNRVLDILRELCLEDERVLASPQPQIFVLNLAESWVEIAVRPWTRQENWWPLLMDLPKLVLERFAREGIDIPMPRRDIAVLEEGEPGFDPPPPPAPE